MIKELLQKLKEKSIDVSLNGDNLDIHYDGELNEAALQEIKHSKADIISFLKNISASASGFSEIPAIAAQPGYALSSSQKRLWVLSQFEDANLAYNMKGVHVFEGTLDVAALQLSFSTLVARHEILRTVFRENGAGEVRQVILSPQEPGFKIIYEDLRLTTEPQSSVDAILAAEAITLFDLVEGPLIRARLLQLEAHTYIFHYQMHHIISDGWSMEIMVKELFTLYTCFSQGKENPLTPLRIQYKDYAAWQQDYLESDALQNHKAYWLEQFKGELPKLELPSDRLRPALKTYNGGSVYKLLDEQTSSGIKQLSMTQGGTLFMGALALVNTLLYRYSGQSDLIIGSGIAGRDHADLENQLGFYLSTLALRTQFKGEDTFTELLGNIKNVTLGAYEHQMYPFDALINDLSLKHDMSRGALFDVSVVLQNTGITASGGQVQSLGGIQVHEYNSGGNLSSTFDLSFTFEEVNEQLGVQLVYNSDIYSQAFAERLLNHLQQLCRSIIASPNTPVCKLNYLSTEETQQLLTGFNATAASYPHDKKITELFEEQAAKNPGATALVSEGLSFTYHDLNVRANQLAGYLLNNYTVKANELIGIRLEKREQVVIAILGILKSGAAYLPIDPEYPEDRISYMISDSNCRLVIDEEELAAFNTERSRHNKFNLATNTAATDLAYIIYTSGSTGKPKGVMVEHRSLVNLCTWHNTTFSVTPADRASLYLGVAFDASVSEMFPYLIAGACLYVIPKALRLDVEALSQYYQQQGITMSALTTQIGEQFLAIENTSLRYLIIGGDKLNLVKPQPYKIVNQYGPTENTVVTTNCILDSNTAYAVLPIGKPISNVHTYILDAHNGLVPVGVAGELCIAGAGLARGYLNNTELNAQKFVANPFHAGERLYKTGDLCKWLPDGTIEYVGRKDGQVKIRGYRIELGEIESALLGYEKTDSAVVIAKADAKGEKSLVAYLMSTAPLNAGELRMYLKTMLPEFMIPEHFVQLDLMPLTANGKIDRAALPNPEGLGIATGVAYIAPRNQTEETLVNIWQEILGREKIGIHDDFFDLGGHSLKATRLSSHIFKAFNVQVSLTRLFTHTTLEEQALLIGQEKTTAFSPIEALPLQPDYDLSSSQKRLWILSQFAEANTVYNIPGVYEFEGSLDVPAFELAFKALIERHEILRTVFKENNTGTVKQVILPAEKIAFKLDVLNLSTHENAHEQLSTLLQSESDTAFDLSTGPLLRIKLIRLPNEKYVLSYVMHHIISDGWSMGILINELLTFYTAYHNDEAPALPPLRIQYKEYAAWQQAQLKSNTLLPEKSYWLKQLEGELPVLEMPGYKLRPAIKTFNGASTGKILNKEITNGIRKLGQQQGATLFMTLLAGINTLLFKYTGQTDQVIGSPVAGRTHQDLKDQIGFYLNTLALRTQFTGAETFAELLEKIKTTTLAAYEHQLYPFDELIEALHVTRNLSRSPLFDVMLVLQNTGTETSNAAGDLNISNHAGSENLLSKFDLTFNITEAGEALGIGLEYNTDIYNPAFAEQLLLHLEQLYSTILASPSVPLYQLGYLNTSEQEQLLTVFNTTSAAYPADKTITQLFEAQVEKTPGNLALVGEAQSFTYHDLNAQANQLAAYLVKNYAVKAGDVFGIKLKKREQMIVAILAVLKSGAAYVPVDPDYPQERTAYIITDSNCRALIDEKALDAFEQEKAAFTNSNPAAVNSATDLAYIIYTSGSTGKPKGVMVEHRSLVNLCTWHNTTFSVTPADRASLYLGVAFDASVSEMFPYLIAGACLYVIPKALRLDVEALSQYYQQQGITMSALTTQIGEQFLAIENTSLRYLIIGGDKLNIVKPQPYKIVNQYGPTENTVVTTNCILDGNTAYAVLPIGKPISNVHTYILDAHNGLVPVGVAGELCIAGAGLARGYLNNTELNAQKFVAHPFHAGERLYKTGDLCKWLPDGTIEYVGRKDGQVKIRGYRIELGEIESALLGYEKTDSAVVIAKADAKGEKSLVAYLMSTAPLNAGELRMYLKTMLPEFMIPEHFVQLDLMPLTANGKIDRAALPNPEGLGIATGVAYTAPRNQTEETLVNIWQEILGRDKIGIHDNFFEAGGNSMKIVQLSKAISAALSKNISVSVLFQYTNIKDLVDYLNQELVEEQVVEKEELIDELNKFDFYDEEV